MKVLFGYQAISGNERAGIAAKSAASALLIMDGTIIKFNLQKYIRKNIKETADEKTDSTTILTIRTLILTSFHLYIQSIAEKSRSKRLRDIGHCKTSMDA